MTEREEARMKKRMGLRIGALLMAMLFVVSLSGCGKPWEKQVKLTDLKLEDVPNNQGGFAWSELTGQIENLTDNNYKVVEFTIEWTFEDGEKEELPGYVDILNARATRKFMFDASDVKNLDKYLGRRAVAYKIKDVKFTINER